MYGKPGRRGVLLPDGEAGYNTDTAFEWAKKNQAQTIVVAPGQEERLPDLSADTLAAVRADLDRGYAVMIPNREQAAGKSGWWRVSLETGETLGQFGDGRGQDAAEFTVVDMVSTGISFLFLGYGIRGCVTSGQSAGVQMCCMTVNFLFFAAGAALGSALTFSQGMQFNVGTMPLSNACNLMN